MPRRPAPLPPSIDPAAFTVDDARRAGVTWSRLQSSDLRRLRHGIYGPAGPAAVSVREWTLDEVRAYQRRHPDVVQVKALWSTPVGSISRLERTGAVGVGP